MARMFSLAPRSGHAILNTSKREETNQMKTENKIPPASIRETIDAIAATRGVTLYRESCE